MSLPASSAPSPPDEPVDTSRAATSRDVLPDATRERFRAGDAGALGDVYDRYGRAVWAVAMTLTRSDQLAQDATQETFIRAWRAAASYDPERDLGPWLLSIARYTTLDLLRRELRPTRGGHEAEQEAAVESPGIDRAWLSWAVQEALHQLTDDEREIVRLTFYEDLTQTEIAARLHLPLGTVKSRSHRLNRRLAQMLAYVRNGPDPDTGSGNRSGPASRTLSEAADEGRTGL